MVGHDAQMAFGLIVNANRSVLRGRVFGGLGFPVEGTGGTIFYDGPV